MQVSVNGKLISTQSTTLQALLSEQSVQPPQRRVAVAVNGRVILRDHWSLQCLQANDDIEIVQAVAGG